MVSEVRTEEQVVGQGGSSGSEGEAGPVGCPEPDPAVGVAGEAAREGEADGTRPGGGLADGVDGGGGGAGIRWLFGDRKKSAGQPSSTTFSPIRWANWRMLWVWSP